MLSRSSVSEVPKERIYRLKAGPKRNYYYFVGISENAESEVFKDIMHIKLLSQMGTQINVFPEGYESFRTSYHRKAVDLSLQTMTIPVPVLKLGLTGWPNSSQTPRIDLIRKAATILDPSECLNFCQLDDPAMEAFPLYHVLLDKAKIFEMKQRIRVHAKKSYSNLILVLKELTHPGKAPVSQDLSEQFERYLALREPEFLRGLLARLDMPDSPAPDPN